MHLNQVKYDTTALPTILFRNLASFIPGLSYNVMLYIILLNKKKSVLNYRFIVCVWLKWLCFLKLQTL